MTPEANGDGGKRMAIGNGQKVETGTKPDLTNPTNLFDVSGYKPFLTTRTGRKIRIIPDPAELALPQG
ncbi:MAG: hypothetical protein Q8P25_03105 [Candidatus Curtissbacteria bacterium]|nr:hypothetical protein [Candidatus Curtissbacteria bacterium]MDZ4209998.1 hypothetical protein [Candidatus Curtissbacteria bacterium]